MNWREMLSDKLMSPAEAVRAVKSGDVVAIAAINCTPFTLCQALYERRAELSGVRIDHPAPLFPWIREGDEGAFTLHDLYATPADRQMVNAGRVEYRPVARWKTGLPPDGLTERPDVYMLPVSPPDKHGYRSFGPGVFFSPSFCRDATTVIGEVHENFIRTGGDNYVHVSQLDRLCEAGAPTGVLPVAPRSDEENLVTEVIGTLVSAELINDGDTIQIGIGTVASAMGAFLGEKQDLGVQTEIITGGVPELVRQGVVTGKRKTRHQGKVVASIALVPEEEMAIIDGNPAFELYEFNYVDDVRYLMQQDNLVAINNALQIDLTGQVAAETIGSAIWSGVGGQTAFAIAANYSNGGRSITVLPSSSLVEGERVSRIVPTLPGGAAVTVPRTLVDYVVTEHGIAHLRGKSLRERAEELIAISHPDFHAELRREGRRAFNIGI